MKAICFVSCMVLVSLVMTFQPAMADDLADLKAANDKYFNAWNSSDVDTFTGLWIDGGVWYSDLRAFPITVKPSPVSKAVWVKYFEDHTVCFTWYNPQFLVIDGTGLVWGHVTQNIMSKSKGIGKESYLKLSLTYVKS
jgi:hypothetical protein